MNCRNMNCRCLKAGFAARVGRKEQGYSYRCLEAGVLLVLAGRT